MKSNRSGGKAQSLFDNRQPQDQFGGEKDWSERGGVAEAEK